MAATKISALAAVAAVLAAQEFAVNDAGTSKKANANQIADFLGIIKAALGSDYTNSTTTGTEITALSKTLAAGTYRFEYYLAAQAAATGTGFDFGVNFTGTQTLFTASLQYQDTGTSATTGVADDVVAADGGELIKAGGVNTALSTTAPNLNVITGVAAANTNVFVIVEGIIVVTVSGDLELWAASDVAASQIAVKAGSNVVITKM